MFDVQIWQMIHYWKGLVLYFYNLQKNCKFAKIEFFIAKSSYIVKLFANINVSKKWKIIHFWKALDHDISNMQKFCKILNNLIFNQEKLKISFDRLFAKKFAIFFLATIVQSVSLCHRLSKKLSFIKGKVG